jgi:PAS domain S-box-containing protein
VSEATAPADVDVALEWLHVMADTAPVMIWMSGTDTRSTYFNKPWLEFTGRSIDRELGIGWSEIIHPDDLERCLQTYGDAFKARREFEMECRQLRYDGVYRWVLGRGRPMHTDDGTFVGYVGSCIDVTERKAAQARRERLLVEGVRYYMVEREDIVERMQRLRQQCDDQQRERLLEEERRRLVREMHEHVEQALFAIGLAATAATAKPPSDPGVQPLLTALGQVNELATAGAQQLREAIFALHHADVQGRGLEPALLQLAADFRRKTGIEADVASTGARRRLPTVVAETLYSVAREGLANVEHHAHAAAVVLGLHIDWRSVTLSIQDDGDGASLEAWPGVGNSTTRFGLRILRERVLSQNGSFFAGPSPEGVFLVRTTLPLAEN